MKQLVVCGHLICGEIGVRPEFYLLQEYCYYCRLYSTYLECSYVDNYFLLDTILNFNFI